MDKDEPTMGTEAIPRETKQVNVAQTHQAAVSNDEARDDSYSKSTHPPNETRQNVPPAVLSSEETRDDSNLKSIPAPTETRQEEEEKVILYASPRKAPTSDTLEHSAIPTMRRLENEDVRAIFESLHGYGPIPVHLPFVLIQPGANGQRLSPPGFEYELGLYVFLRPDKSDKYKKDKSKRKSYAPPKVPPHLQHLLWDPGMPENCVWGLSGPQFPKPTAIQQRYCYPRGHTCTTSYKSQTGGSLWTMYTADGKEDHEFRLLHVYHSDKRARNRGVDTPPGFSMGASPEKAPKRTKPNQTPLHAHHSLMNASPSSSIKSAGTPAQVVTFSSSASTSASTAASATSAGATETSPPPFASPGNQSLFSQHSYQRYHPLPSYPPYFSPEYSPASWNHHYQPHHHHHHGTYPPPPIPPRSQMISQNHVSPHNGKEDEMFPGCPFHPVQQCTTMDSMSPYWPQDGHPSLSPIYSPPLPRRTTGPGWNAMSPPMFPNQNEEEEQDSKSSLSMLEIGTSLNDIDKYWSEPYLSMPCARNHGGGAHAAQGKMKDGVSPEEPHKSNLKPVPTPEDSKSSPSRLPLEQLESLQKGISDLIAHAPTSEQECLVALVTNWVQDLAENPLSHGQMSESSSPAFSFVGPSAQV